MYQDTEVTAKEHRQERTLHRHIALQQKPEFRDSIRSQKASEFRLFTALSELRNSESHNITQIQLTRSAHPDPPDPTPEDSPRVQGPALQAASFLNLNGDHRNPTS